MSFTQRRTTRLALLLGTAAAVAGTVTVAGAAQTSSAATPVASDYCLNVGPIWVEEWKVYPGGLYCVPVPDPSSQAT